MTGGAVKTTMDKPVVVIDPGHGGLDGGCVSVDGTPEKGINLAVAESLRDGLKLLGYDVVCTRESDISITTQHRGAWGAEKVRYEKPPCHILEIFRGHISFHTPKSVYRQPLQRCADVLF